MHMLFTGTAMVHKKREKLRSRPPREEGTNKNKENGEEQI